jgi:predicted dehydrogenase
MAEPSSVALVGIGGYGEVYLSALLDDQRSDRARIVGAVDPEPERCSRLGDLQSRGIPVFEDVSAFCAEHDVDLAVISSPIHLHPEHVCDALAHGSHVLVEKPAAAVPADVDRMIAARDRAGRFVAVGFQWSFAASILELKRDILAGQFGTPHGGRCLTLWPRTERYYRRNDWTGRKRDADGRWILDSPICNAMAHDLHNLLFLLGDRMDRSAEPVGIAAQLARANDIETFDTVAARVYVASGAELLFLASHAVATPETVEPRFTLAFDQATVTFPGEMAPITARFHDGRVVEYASPYATPQVAKLWKCLDALSGKGEVFCGLEAARPHAACVEALEISGVPVHQFTDAHAQRSATQAGPLRWVEGLAPALVASYETGDWPEFPT